jgi:hypothetical protein
MKLTESPDREECGGCDHYDVDDGIPECSKLAAGLPCVYDEAEENDLPEIANFWFMVEVDLDITKKALGVMLRCSEAHYDGKCKAASKQGGFLYGWKNHFELPESKNFIRVRATWRQVDTLCKILEMERHFSDRGDSQPVYQAIRAVMKQMAQESKRVNGG